MTTPAPTLAEQVWAIRECRGVIFDAISGTDRRTALLLSKATFGEALQAVFGTFEHDNLLRLRKAMGSFTRHRRYLRAVHTLRFPRCFIAPGWLADLAETYPNLRRVYDEDKDGSFSLDVHVSAARTDDEETYTALINQTRPLLFRAWSPEAPHSQHDVWHREISTADLPSDWNVDIRRHQSDAVMSYHDIVVSPSWFTSAPSLSAVGFGFLCTWRHLSLCLKVMATQSPPRLPETIRAPFSLTRASDLVELLQSAGPQLRSLQQTHVDRPLPGWYDESRSLSLFDFLGMQRAHITALSALDELHLVLRHPRLDALPLPFLNVAEMRQHKTIEEWKTKYTPFYHPPDTCPVHRQPAGDLKRLHLDLMVPFTLDTVLGHQPELREDDRELFKALVAEVIMPDERMVRTILSIGGNECAYEFGIVWRSCPSHMEERLGAELGGALHEAFQKQAMEMGWCPARGATSEEEKEYS